jgi:hypothetical protein
MGLEQNRYACRFNRQDDMPLHHFDAVEDLLRRWSLNSQQLNEPIQKGPDPGNPASYQPATQ